MNVDNDDFEKQSEETGCGVAEGQFPLMLHCCLYSGLGTLQKYQKLCPFCQIWTLPPDGRSLEVATLFECGRYGYDRRLKE